MKSYLLDIKTQDLRKPPPNCTAIQLNIILPWCKDSTKQKPLIFSYENGFLICFPCSLLIYIRFKAADLEQRIVSSRETKYYRNISKL
ncbi:hypothetical protein Peur_009654 [Populus x canadensis]